MSRKKGQLLSEISHNLKQTIKKYNELAIDDNFFNDELKSKSTNNYCLDISSFSISFSI